MADKKSIEVPGLSKGLSEAKVPLSSVIKANGFLFLSGMPPLDVETGAIVKNIDIARQTQLCLEGIKHVLASAGSTMEKVVSVRVYCTDAAQFAKVNEVYARYFPTDPPARTFIPVGSWEMGFDVELECVALA